MQNDARGLRRPSKKSSSNKQHKTSPAARIIPYKSYLSIFKQAPVTGDPKLPFQRDLTNSGQKTGISKQGTVFSVLSSGLGQFSVISIQYQLPEFCVLSSGSNQCSELGVRGRS